MKRKMKLALAGAVSTIAITSSLAIQPIRAADTNPMDSLIGKLATRFNLNESEVQQVFNEHRNEQKAAHEEKLLSRLDQAVTDGKITAEQKEKIVNKMEEVKNRLKEIREIDDEQARREAHQQLMTELKQWASDNGIDSRWLGPLGHKRGFGKGGHGPAPSDAAIN